MFNWFKKRSELNSLNVYHPKERLIYTYWDGEKEIKADPLVLYKKVMDKGPELSINLKVSVSISKDASSHHNLLVNQIREIFDLKSLKDGGSTEMETIGLLDHFLNFCSSLKKNSPLYQTSSNPMEDSTSSSQENQPISNSLDSGYVNKESITEEQEQLPMEQGSQ